MRDSGILEVDSGWVNYVILFIVLAIVGILTVLGIVALLFAVRPAFLFKEKFPKNNYGERKRTLESEKMLPIEPEE